MKLNKINAIFKRKKKKQFILTSNKQKTQQETNEEEEKLHIEQTLMLLSSKQDNNNFYHNREMNFSHIKINELNGTHNYCLKRKKSCYKLRDNMLLLSFNICSFLLTATLIMQLICDIVPIISFPQAAATTATEQGKF